MQPIDTNQEPLAGQHPTPTIPFSQSVIRLIRHVPETLLDRYMGPMLAQSECILETGFGGRARVRELTERLAGLNDELLGSLVADAERIVEMTDDLGQEALCSIARDQEMFCLQENAYARSLWVFLHEPGSFRRAEEVRYADNYRLGRMWDGFVGPKDVVISANVGHHREFEDRIRSYFRSGQVKVEIYERTRPDIDDGEHHLLQVVVYREGLPDSFLEFDGKELARRPWRPVFEFALTYEADSGVIEVVAQGRECREEMARAFSETLLRQKIESERVPLRRYDLTTLMSPRHFPTDVEDGIESVEVTMLTLHPVDDGRERVTFEADRKSSVSIYERVFTWFSEHSPLISGFRLHRVRLAVRFLPEEGFGRGKTINVQLSLPNGCNLKSKSERERMVCEKYLPRWNLVREV